MNRIMLAFLIAAYSAIACAADAENIQACVKRANEFAGVRLNEFDASYESNFFSQNIVKWKNAYCEVKMSSVYNLQVNGKQVIFNSFAGRESYDLNRALSAKTESATNQLRSRIALLEQRMSQVTAGLKVPKPDHAGLSRFIDEGIDKSLGAQRQAADPAASSRQNVGSRAEEQGDLRQPSVVTVPAKSDSIKQPESQTEVSLSASISSGDIEAAIGASDDYSSYKQVFIQATAKLIENGTCNIAELKEYGGWVKSQKHKGQPVYFTYCGGMTIRNRIYIDASSGSVFR